MSKCVQAASDDADAERASDGQRHRKIGVLRIPHHAEQDGREAHQRTDRKIDAAGHDDWRHRQREQADFGQQASDFERVLPRHEVFADDAEDGDLGDQDRGEDKLVGEAEAAIDRRFAQRVSLAIG